MSKIGYHVPLKMAYSKFTMFLAKGQQAGCQKGSKKRRDVVTKRISCKAWQDAESPRETRMESGIVIACNVLLTWPVTVSSAAWTLYPALFQVPAVELPRDHSKRWNGLGQCD